MLRGLELGWSCVVKMELELPLEVCWCEGGLRGPEFGGLEIQIEGAGSLGVPPASLHDGG